MAHDPPDVRFETRWLPAAAAPGTPLHLNRVGIRRYALAGPTPLRAVPPRRTILALMPGFMGGVNSLHTVGLTLAGADGGQVEVWAVDRRNHLLEDLRGMEQAQATGDAAPALVYYFGGDPGAFTPVRPTDVPWMAHWGLEVAVTDARAVVREARKAVGDSGRVFLGGHSLGGMLAQCYAAWDFGGTPGHEELDGVILLDGAVGGPDWTATVGLAQYRDGSAAIAAGEVFWNRPERGTAPQITILAQIAAMAASLPTSRHQPSLIVPYVANHFSLPEGVLLTNEAALGYLLDAKTGPVPTYRAHVGELDSTPLTVIEGRPLLGWRRSADTPTDLARVAHALRMIDGANGMEWYASRRLNAEVDLSSNLDSRDSTTRALAEGAGLRLWHNASVRLPVFGAVTGSSEQARSRYTWYRDSIHAADFTLLELPEYDHLDPLFAEDLPNSNRCLAALSEWLATAR